MEQDNIADFFPEYLGDRLDSHQKREVEKYLMVCAQCKTEKEELETLFSAFKNKIPAEPSAAVRKRFEKMLESEEQKTSKGPKIIPI